VTSGCGDDFVHCWSLAYACSSTFRILKILRAACQNPFAPLSSVNVVEETFCIVGPDFLRRVNRRRRHKESLIFEMSLVTSTPTKIDWLNQEFNFLNRPDFASFITPP